MKYKVEKILKKLALYKDKGLIAIVLGSGLSELASSCEDATMISYESLGMPKSKVEGHVGRFIFGRIGNTKVVFFTRYHYYESGNLELVRLPFEILAGLGVKTVVLTTATGALKKDLNVGELVLISDYINLTGVNPYVNNEVVRFFSVDKVYDKDYQKIILKIAKKYDIQLKTGTHVQLSGPNYETIAEVKMLALLGGSTVSMSTALDSIICAYNDMKVLAFACITDNILQSDKQVTHEKVLQVAGEASKNLTTLVVNFVKMLEKR